MITEWVYKYKDKMEGKGEDEQLDQNDKNKDKHLVRQPGEAEEGDNDEEHLDHPLLVGQHCTIPHSVPLARRPDVCKIIEKEIC